VPGPQLIIALPAECLDFLVGQVWEQPAPRLAAASGHIVDNLAEMTPADASECRQQRGRHPRAGFFIKPAVQ